MSADTCAVLTAVFPLVLLAFLAERRSLRLKVRKMRIFRRIAEYTTMFTIFGLVAAVVGVQLGGLEGVAALITWAFFVAAIMGLLVLTGFHLASAEIGEDEDAGGATV